MNEILKEDILNLGSDRLDVFGGKYEGGIHLQQNIPEIVELIEFLIDQKKDFRNFLEIGAAVGGNTVVLNKYLNFENIVIIDDNKHERYHLRKDVLKDIKYKEYVGDSQTIEANNYVKNLNLTFDIIFIDADHSYNGVKNDTYNYIEFLKEGGYIIFHDSVYCNGITMWCNKLKSGVIENLSFLNTFKDDDNNWPKGISVFKKI